jgi:hypothetical protein
MTRLFDSVALVLIVLASVLCFFAYRSFNIPLFLMGLLIYLFGYLAIAAGDLI